MLTNDRLESKFHASHKTIGNIGKCSFEYEIEVDMKLNCPYLRNTISHCYCFCYCFSHIKDMIQIGHKFIFMFRRKAIHILIECNQCYDTPLMFNYRLTHVAFQSVPKSDK